MIRPPGRKQAAYSESNFKMSAWEYAAPTIFEVVSFDLRHLQSAYTLLPFHSPLTLHTLNPNPHNSFPSKTVKLYCRNRRIAVSFAIQHTKEDVPIKVGWV